MRNHDTPQVFINYYQSDLERVRKLHADLKDRGVNVWFDRENLLPGKWKPQIIDAIASSKFFVICMSHAALGQMKAEKKDEYYHLELQQAYEIAQKQDNRSFAIIPVRLEECGRGDHRLSAITQVDLFEDWEKELDKLAVFLCEGVFDANNSDDISSKTWQYDQRMDPDKPQVFICYSHWDINAVRKLYADLKDIGVNAWFDMTNLAPGTYWKKEIGGAIASSRIFLFCLSNAALEDIATRRGEVNDQLQQAYEIAQQQDHRSFTIVPLRLEECGHGDHRLSVFQQYDLFADWEKGIKHLAVQLRGEKIDNTNSNALQEQAPLENQYKGRNVVRDQIFISYSHSDRKWMLELKKMLKPLVRDRTIKVWSDSMIRPGSDWKSELDTALNSAKVAILLVSADFLASDFIHRNELPPLLRASREEGLVIFWIYISSCLYKATDISKYQAAHSLSRPLDRMNKPKRQEVLAEICSRIKEILA